jgi:hypothetical protein
MVVVEVVVLVVVDGIGTISHEGVPGGMQGDLRSATMSLKHIRVPAHVLKFPSNNTPFGSHGKYCVLLKQAKPFAQVLHPAPLTSSWSEIIKKVIKI